MLRKFKEVEYVLRKITSVCGMRAIASKKAAGGRVEPAAPARPKIAEIAIDFYGLSLGAGCYQLARRYAIV